MKSKFLILLLLTSFLVSCKAVQPELLLISTTSTQDSGLLDVLIPAFEKQSGYKVKLVATGSGQALKLGAEGNADVILLHSPAAEEEFMQNGFGIDRRPVMHNDFVLVGPPADPAMIRGENLSAALNKIFISGSVFISRGDESGTHVKELALWKKAGIDPTGSSWYIETGQGQGATLTIASEKSGYALTDRGTFLAYRPNVNLEILVENDPDLLNIYHVLTVNPQKWPQVNIEGAKAFSDFITSPEGQEIIRTFGVEQYGQPLFFPDVE